MCATTVLDCVVRGPRPAVGGWRGKIDRRRSSRSDDRAVPAPKLPWKTDQSVLASPLRSWSLATPKHGAQGRKAAPAGGPIGTKSGGSITPKSGGPIPTKSGGSNQKKSCTQLDLWSFDAIWHALDTLPGSPHEPKRTNGPGKDKNNGAQSDDDRNAVGHGPCFKAALD